MILTMPDWEESVAEKWYIIKTKIWDGGGHILFLFCINLKYYCKKYLSHFSEKNSSVVNYVPADGKTQTARAGRQLLVVEYPTRSKLSTLQKGA